MHCSRGPIKPGVCASRYLCVDRFREPRRGGSVGPTGTTSQYIRSRTSLPGRCLGLGIQPFLGGQLKHSCQNGSKWVAAQWLDNSAFLNVPVSIVDCWALWQDRELMPKWMPWITSVKLLEEDPALSRWTLSTYQFNRTWEFSWIARNLAPIPYQKIHWRSEPEGGNSFVELNNRGQVRFLPKADGSCGISITVSYEVPDILAPFANAVTPIVENVLLEDLKRFSQYAQNHVKDLSPSS